MAATTTKGTKRTGKSTARKKGAKSTAKRSSGGKATKARSASDAGPKAPSKQTQAANAAVARQSAVAGTKAAGRAVAAAAKQAKTPLIVGGAAAAGIAGGLIAQRRSSRSRFNPNGLSKLPIRDGKLDLGALASAAHKAGELGQQMNDIGTAIDRAQGRKR